MSTQQVTIFGIVVSSNKGPQTNSKGKGKGKKVKVNSNYIAPHTNKRFSRGG